MLNWGLSLGNAMKSEVHERLVMIQKITQTLSSEVSPEQSWGRDGGKVQGNFF